MSRNPFKKTLSLCPVCLNPIPAKLFNTDGYVKISKQCPVHGFFHATVDPDAHIYLKCRKKKATKRHAYGLVLPITYACNLSCQWCYLPEFGSPISINEIRNIIDHSQHSYIVFSGGEPTLSRELLPLIRYVKHNHPKKYSILLTNGIKLADPEYVAQLKKAGLNYVILSFNGFKDEAYQMINNKNLQVIKMRALNNLERYRIWTILSVTLVKGLNEKEFEAIYHYALKNIHFIRQIRLRNVSQIGHYVKSDHIYLSDMIKLISQTTQLSIDDLLKDNERSNGLFKTGNYFVVDVLKALRRKYGKKVFQKIKFWHNTFKLVGLRNGLRVLAEPYRSKQNRYMLRLEIFAWPTANNIDLEECRKFCVDHINHLGQVRPFWEALFDNDRQRRRQEKATEQNTVSKTS